MQNNYNNKFIKTFLITTGLIGSCISLGQGVYYWFSAEYFFSLYQLIAAPLPYIVYFIYLRNHNINQSVFLFSLIIIYVSFFMVFSSAVDGENLLIFQVMPVILFFILPSKDALKSIFFLWTLLVAFFILSLIAPEITTLTPRIIFIALISFTFISILLSFYDKRYTNSINIIIEEVEKNKKKDLQLMKQSRSALMGDMLSIIAHQWRQPLSSITSNTLNLQLKMDLEDEINKEYFRKKLNSIENLSINLSTTIDDFRNVYTSENKSNTFFVHEMINSALEICSSLFDSHNITIKKDFQIKKEIKNFENELIQAVVNIIRNSVDALVNNTTVKAKIGITISEEDNYIIISIADNAGGISNSIEAKIFDPYFSTKDAKNGVGLGLYMSKSIIENNCHGKLSFNNTADGACFTIALLNHSNI